MRVQMGCILLNYRFIFTKRVAKCVFFCKFRTRVNTAATVSAFLDKRELEKVYMKLTTAPKREVHGLTFTQNVGVFPRQVSLEIRHTHPALGLNEVAHQRQRHSQVQDNHFTQQQQQCHYQNLQPQHNVRFHEFCL